MGKTKRAIRKPSEVYQACPACHSKELIRLEVDVICGHCDWMSCEQFVESGGMDNIFSAFNEHFGSEPSAIDVAELTKVEGADFVTPLSESAPLDVEEIFETEASA